jgi:putative membrane protein
MMRSIPFSLGVLALAVLWFGPLPLLAKQVFWAHMALHMGVVAVAAPLLAAGIGGGRYDPVRRVPALLPPVPLSIMELVVVWAWHAPALHHAARHSLAGLLAEQASFLIAGLLVWLSVLGGDGPQRRERLGAGIAALLLTSMHMTLLGALLALSPRPLYLHHRHAPEFELMALADQHLGGAIMLLVGGAAYLAGGLWLTIVLVRGRSIPPRREELA